MKKHAPEFILITVIAVTWFAVAIKAYKVEHHVTNYYNVYPDGHHTWVAQSTGVMDNVYIKQVDIKKLILDVLDAKHATPSPAPYILRRSSKHYNIL